MAEGVPASAYSRVPEIFTLPGPMKPSPLMSSLPSSTKVPPAYELGAVSSNVPVPCFSSTRKLSVSTEWLSAKAPLKVTVVPSAISNVRVDVEDAELVMNPPPAMALLRWVFPLRS